MGITVIKIFTLATTAFLLATAATPFLTYFLYHYKLGKQIRQNVPHYFLLHKHKKGTPTMGGIVIWGTVLFLAVIFAILGKMDNFGFLPQLDFLSRRETLLPLGALVSSAVVGLIDDYLGIIGFGKDKQGVRFRYKIFLYIIIALWGALWFYYKLDWDVIHIPFLGDFTIGWLVIPYFIFITVATSFAVNETDGLDGLAGGVLLTNFAAFGAIAFVEGKYDLAGFCAVIVGALTAFLWFNVPPARFFMGDTGAMSLGAVLAIIAFYLKSSLILPIVGLVLVVEALSVIIQLASRKMFHKKIFASTPLHHHLETKGWPESKIVMRVWLISGVSSMIGFVIVLLDKTL